QGQGGAQLGEQPDRTVGVGHADVDVQRERRLAAREVGHRALDDLVAAGGRRPGLGPERARMRPGARDREAELGELLGQPDPQVAELRDRVGDALVRVRGELDRRLVRLRAHVCQQPVGELREDVVAALGERPVLRIEEHHLLLDANRVRPRRLPPRPAGPRRHLLGLSTHVSLAPPFCEEFTTRAPASHATRVRPPGVNPIFTSVANMNGRRSTCRGSRRPSPTTVGWFEIAMSGWATKPSGAAVSWSRTCWSVWSSACAQTTTPAPPCPNRGLTTCPRRSPRTASRWSARAGSSVGTAATSGSSPRYKRIISRTWPWTSLSSATPVPNALTTATEPCSHGSRSAAPPAGGAPRGAG